MNDKIKKLWYDAQLGFNDQQCEPEVAEQFANLIIKECIDLCDEIEDDYLKEFGDRDISIGAGACSYKISAHFGVE